MAASTTRRAFWKGMRDGAPFIIGAAPFAALFGVVATEAGLNLAEVMGMCVLVIAGASQFAALAQMQDAAPVIFVVAAALTVNLRMAMYSASLSVHLNDSPLWQRVIAAYILVDNSYAVGVSEYETRPGQKPSAKMAYFIGCAVPVWIVWYAAAFAGAVLGQAIPPEFALDFAVPIAFLAIVSPMLRTVAHVAAALTSIVVALLLAFMPYGTGLFVAAGVAMLIGSEVERRMERNKA